MIWLNHNSTIVLGLVVFSLAGYFLLRDGIRPRDILLLSLLAVVLGLIWLRVRPRQMLPVEVGEWQSVIGAGSPVLLEIQSPY